MTIRCSASNSHCWPVLIVVKNQALRWLVSEGRRQKFNNLKPHIAFGLQEQFELEYRYEAFDIRAARKHADNHGLYPITVHSRSYTMALSRIIAQSSSSHILITVAGLSSLLPIISSSSFCEDAEESGRTKPRLIFLGTGSSTGCPRPNCPMVFSSKHHVELQKDLEPFCKVSNLALRNDPRSNKNYRNNPSLLVSTGHQTVIIDVGKTFREGALRWLPHYGIGAIDAIVLTHPHMDAAAGLDDVRGFQMWDFFSDRISGVRKHIQVPMPLFLSLSCLEELSERFPWLLPKKSMPETPNDGKPVVVRHVASFDVHVFQPLEEVSVVEGLKVIPLPVMHGEDLISYGFAFTVGNLNVVYLSDISRMLPDTLHFIQHQLPPTDLLIVDALLLDHDHPVHYSLKQAAALSKTLHPARTLLVGMNCDAFLPHDEMNRVLRQKYGNLQLAHDGLVIHAT